MGANDLHWNWYCRVVCFLEVKIGVGLKVVLQRLLPMFHLLTVL